MKILNPGTLDEMIVIEQKTLTKSPLNSPIETWSNFKECWASITLNSSKEELIGDRNVSVSTYDIYIRYDETIDSTMRIRIKCDSTIIQISGILSNRRDGYQTIIGKKVDAF